jgi:hypothetical protein
VARYVTFTVYRQFLVLLQLSRTDLSATSSRRFPLLTVFDFSFGYPSPIIAAGQRFGLQVDKVLHHEKSEYQVHES